jgi:hypothetical protein
VIAVNIHKVEKTLFCIILNSFKNLHKIVSALNRLATVAPPRSNIAGRCYCAYPSIWESVPQGPLPVEAVQVNEDNLLDLGLGWPIYSKAQVEDFLRFQYSKGAQRAERAESAELPTEDVARMDPRNSGWENEQEQPLLKKYVGWSLVPLV